MTDLFPDIALGEALVEVLTLSFKAASAITKGDLVEMNTHTAGEIGSVSTINADADIVVGMALKDIASGDYGPVCVIGVVKVKSCGSITLGNSVKSEYTSNATPVSLVVASGAAEKGHLGVALQTFTDEDEGLIILYGSYL